MVLNKTILILEDNLNVLSKLLNTLYALENDQPYDFSIIILTTHEQVKNYINENPKAQFDIVLLDRDCKLNGSFHTLDIERFGVDKVIAISSIPEYNEQIRELGVKRIILKDMQNLDEFSIKITKEVEDMITTVKPIIFK
jgi:hypothetical protein